MKQFLVLSFLFSIATLSAQPSLQKVFNLFRTGDKLIKQQVEYKSPGESGKDILWDFSKQKSIDDAYELEYFSWDEDATIIGREHRTLYKYKECGDSLFMLRL